MASIGDLLAQTHQDASRLADHVGTPDLENLRDRLEMLGAGLASVGDDRATATPPAGGRKETVLDLVTSLHKDLASLAVALHNVDPSDESWAPIGKELLADWVQLQDMAGKLKGAQSGYELVPHATAPRAGAGAPTGTTPGARPTSLDAAGRLLQTQLAQQNRKR